MKKTAILICVILILSSNSLINAGKINLINTEKNDTFEEKNLLPSSFSWRDIDGIDYTTPIKNQAPAPTCEAYALCAALETLMQYQVGEVYGADVSETHLYFYAGGSYESGYVNIEDAADYLIEHGVPDEGCYPDPHRGFDYPFESLEGWEDRTVKITEWGWIEKTEKSIKTALIEHGPLSICLIFWTDFLYYKGGVYIHRWGKIAGGHVLTMVGYDDNERCWIVKNSAGTNWGIDGWLKLSYDANMFAEWYGPRTGVMYIDGVYGNLQPDVPKINIEIPAHYKTYIFGREIPIIFKNLNIQKASPRILGDLTVEVSAENTNLVEFYIDDVKQHTDDEAPFTWDIETSQGLHTLEARAYNDYNISIDIVDIYLFI